MVVEPRQGAQAGGPCFSCTATGGAVPRVPRLFVSRPLGWRLALQMVKKAMTVVKFEWVSCVAL